MTSADILELEESAYTIEKERDLLSAVLDAAKGLLVVVLDREGRIVQFNRVCQELTGYSLEEVKGRRPWDFLIPADERQKIKKVNRENVSGKPNQAENHWVTKDGRSLLIGWSNSPVISDGIVESVVATGIDHTERAKARQRARESEATVRALLETAAQAIIAVNREGQIVLANATTEKMFGHNRDELIGQSVEQLMPEFFRKRHSQHMVKWFEDPRNRQLGGMELTGLRKDGSEFPIEINLSHIEIQGEVMGVAFISDITERRKNEEALLDYHRRLQRLSGSLLNIQETENQALAREMHDAFSQELAALGMEVSNLLTSAELAGPLTERLGSLGEKIRYLADEMHRTSRRLHPAILSELGLEAALRAECDAFSQQCGIPVRCTCEKLSSAALPQEVSLCLYRVAQESLSNIRKYARAKEVTLHVRCEDGHASLRIEDTGVGFDVDEARRKGGLGLISMEERVRLVNGKLDIRSKRGVGTTVEVSVPLKEAGA